MDQSRAYRELRNRHISPPSRGENQTVSRERRPRHGTLALSVSSGAWIALQLLFAAILGAAIGAQRQATHKPAGLRTHALVALGSCAFMELSRLTGDTRLAANILTGIGFLGAGAIVRDGATPRGLTTAASIWTAAAIGTATGYGIPLSYALALATTALTLLVLAFSDETIGRFFPPKRAADVRAVFDLTKLTLDDVVATFARYDLPVHRTDRLTIARDGDALVATWYLRAPEQHHRRLREALVGVAREAGFRALEIEPVRG